LKPYYISDKKMLIKKKDKVIVISGDEQGKSGEVLKVFRDKGTVLVTKINFVKRHTKPTQGDPGGIKEKEAPVKLSSVMLICPKCNKPGRPKSGKFPDGKKARICRKCGEMIV